MSTSVSAFPSVLVGGTEMKAHSEKFMNENDVKVTDEDGFFCPAA